MNRNGIEHRVGLEHIEEIEHSERMELIEHIEHAEKKRLHILEVRFLGFQ